MIVCVPTARLETVRLACPPASTGTAGPSGVPPSSKVTEPEPTAAEPVVTDACSWTGAPASAGSGAAVTVVLVADETTAIDTSSDTSAVSAAGMLAGTTMLTASPTATGSALLTLAGGTTLTASPIETDSATETLAGGTTLTASLVPTGSSVPMLAGPDSGRGVAGRDALVDLDRDGPGSGRVVDRGDALVDLDRRGRGVGRRRACRQRQHGEPAREREQQRQRPPNGGAQTAGATGHGRPPAPDLLREAQLDGDRHALAGRDGDGRGQACDP